MLTGIGLGTNAFAGAQGCQPSHLPAGGCALDRGRIVVSLSAPALVADFAPADRRGAYQGTYQLAWAVASTVAPMLGSLVLARLGAPALWLGCLAVCLLAATLHLRSTARRPLS